MKSYLVQIRYILLITLLGFFSPAWANDTVLRVDVTGIENPALANVQARLKIAEKNYAHPLSEASIKAFYAAAPKNIQSAIEPFGYFDSHVSPHLSRQNDTWTATFQVYPGHRLRITALHLSISGPGKNNPEIQKYITHFPLHTGSVFSAESYDKAKQDLFNIAQNQGYVKAYLEQKAVEIDLKKRTVVITLELNTAKRFYFGPIHFDQSVFSDEFLKRFLSFKKGQPFSSDKILTFQQNLTNSHFFSEVNITPNLTDIQYGEVPIEVKLTPVKSQQYNIGGGYGTFTGPRMTLGINLRHLTPTGHHLEMKMRLSPILSGLAAQYVIPGDNPLTDEYLIGANGQRFKPKNGSSKSITLFVGYVKKYAGWKHTLTLNFLHENYDIFEDPSSRKNKTFYPSYSINRIVSNDVLHPSQGYKLDATLRGATKKILSNTQFIQTELKAKGIYSPTEHSRVIVSGDFGYTSVSNILSLPLTLQFFAGGMDSIRGFPANYFGPGRYTKVGSLELQHTLIGKVDAAVFYDIGVADDHINAPMGKGMGVGLVYNSLVGPIRGYVGVGHLHNKSRHISFDFSLGPDL